MAYRRWGAVLMVGGALVLLHGCGSDGSSSGPASGGTGGNQGGRQSSGGVGGSQGGWQSGGESGGPDWGPHGGEAGASIVLIGGAPGTAGEVGSAGAALAGQAGESSAGGVGGSSGEADGCASADVLVLIPQDDDMFERPTLDGNYMMMSKAALTSPDGALAPFERRLRMRAIFFALSSNYIACPIIGGYSEPRPTLVEDLAIYFDDVLDSYAGALGMLFDPVKDALEYAERKLQGKNRHVVLLTTGFPDTCTLGRDTFCLMDPTIKALQDAHTKGITTHVIGLGDVAERDSTDSESYERYLAQLANAGAG